MKLSTNIIDHCNKRGWSLTKLAKVSGVPVQTLHGWTTGRKALNLLQVKAIANVFEVSVHELVFGEPDPFERNNSENEYQEIFSGDLRVTLHRIVRK